MLVGRDRELEVINEVLAVLADGRGSALFFAGEPGIGKSTLARRLSEQARASSLPVYSGFCWEAGGAPAYWPWTQLLRSLVAEQDISPELLARLGQLLPETANDAAQPDLQPDMARFQLLESVRALLDHVSQSGPLVLLIEDLHAADADSLHLLQYLARHTQTLPVLLVGTYRELEARRSSAADPLWHAGRDARVLKLARLDEQAVQEYLDASGFGSGDSEQVGSLFATTGGNPLFLSELVGLIGQGREDALPETVQQVIGQQISLLPDSTANALRHASLLGREFDVTVLAMLQDTDEHATELVIEPAATAEIIHPVKPGCYRFSHLLHRDVLYNSLDTTTRQELHTRCAEYVRTLIDAGDEDRWPLCANHLQAAGSDYRIEAIAAWEKSAERAHARLAFDDAALSLQNALAIFGDGPKFDPSARCALQVRYARAAVLAGDIETGQAQCREAFATARTLGHTPLMAEAALTFGDAIVVGRVDKEHIGMLQECLEVIPLDDVAMRARTQARLAAAMQPAVYPTEPMDMAREAIALARTTNDEATLFAVLRFAISALMDFSSASERIPLNREFEALAAKQGNVACQFRSNLRLIVDAIEIGDRPMLDAAIDSAEHIANRIGLPHYQWRVASAIAMQQMIDGRFSRAMKLIEQAQQLADQVNDLEAKITLPVQRFAVLCDWNSDQTTPLAEIEAQLRDAYSSGMSATEFFIEPFITAYSATDAASCASLLEDKAVLDRTFSGGDRFSMALVGELAIAVGNVALAERAYEALVPFAEECTTLGLMGSCWSGPVGHTLGIIATGLGNTAAANKHLESALAIATRMHSQPVIARILLAQARVAVIEDDDDRAATLRSQADKIVAALSLREVPRAPGGERPAIPTSTTPEIPFEVTLDGDIRVIRYRGDSVSLKDNKGLQILAKLIAVPDKDVHVLDLVGSPTLADAGDAGPQLDNKARDEYRQRVAELQEELEDAVSLSDTGRADAVREELDFITRELSRAYGLGGRDRPSGSAAERARVNVRRRLKDAIKRIGEQLPDAGRYLENTIKTGRYCRYSPM